MVDLDIQIATQNTTIPTEKDLELWVNAVLTQQNLANKEMTIRIVDEAEIQQLNHQYRGKDRATNVLSFPFEQPNFGDFPVAIDSELNNEFPTDLLGDIIICCQVVASEATQQHKKLFDHWAHMIVHGTLHLLGYDHIEDGEAETMENLERTILSELGIDDPYQNH